MYKVLIVEDDPMVSMINEQFVNRHGEFTVIHKCSDGKGALEYMENNSVDLIILDVFMPYLNGFEMLREIRNRKIETDVIMVTAADEVEDLKEGLHLGVVDYLVKPFTFERFKIALDKFIAQSSAFKEPGKINQKNIDFLIRRKSSEDIFPKGINEKTLHMIVEYLMQAGEKWMTCDDIAENVGLTSVTIRRYMSHLSNMGTVTADVDYETGGRPCTKYKIFKRKK